MFWTTVAYAMGGPGQAAAEGGTANLMSSIMTFAIIIAIFYFLLFRPQQKRAKEHRQMLDALKRGDKVITAGGLYGKVVEVNEHTCVLDLGDSKVTVGRQFISGLTTEGAAKAAPAKKETNKPADKENDTDTTSGQ